MRQLEHDNRHGPEDQQGGREIPEQETSPAGPVVVVHYERQ
jgi:hypothetical protein